MSGKLVLVTGATGYIASRLIPRLLDKGYRVRALARQPQRLPGRSWSRHVELIPAEALDPSSLAPTLAGVWSAYYLIHNMSFGRGYTRRELEAAHNFADAAAQAGLEHILYLGGLADPAARIAAHLRSRIETGEILRRGRVPVTELRAGVIVGPGSISFEMIRFMTELFPLVPGPAWLGNKSQPIAAQNVLDYLLAALENPGGRGGVFEIGGPDVISYGDLMLEYARLRGLQRRLVALPYMPLWFMALGVDLMTPVPRRIAHALLEGLRSDSIVRAPAARRVFPGVKLITYEQAVTAALEQLHPDRIEPVWRDMNRPAAILKHEGFLIDHRRLYVNTAPERVMQVVASLGGEGGWLYANRLWKLRGWINGSPPPAAALRSPRRGSLPKRGEGLGVRESLRPGALIDFYRVEAVDPDRLLLRSQLKAPGEAWMEWRVGRTVADLSPRRHGHAAAGGAGPIHGTTLTQTSFFAPRGLPGFLYWALLYPFHSLVFRGLIRAIARHAASPQSSQSPRSRD